MKAFDLTGKTAVITGSSKGIGRAIAEHMAEAGAAVAISSRKEGACQEVAQAIRQKGGKAVAIAANVSKKSDVERLIERTASDLGPVDILVCNAAVNPYYGPLADITDEAYHKTLDTNVLSIMWK